MITIYEKNVAQSLAMTYQRCKIHSTNPVKINFRCPLCDDSAKSATKARGWFYEYENELRFGCFNCNANYRFGSYLEKFYPEQYREWLRDRRGEQPKLEDKREKELFSIKKREITLPLCERLDKLSDEHPAKKYMLQRMIPRDKLCLFYFTMEWKKVANHVFKDTYPQECIEETEPRIVIPIYNRENKIESVQGRALRKSDEIRYITIKSEENSSKVFGVERVDNTKDPVFVFEGPIDSVFIKNGIAMSGGQVDINVVPFKERRVWVLDNENRSPDTMNRYEKLINQGEKVVLWDQALWKSKDINDMILKENASQEMIYEYLCNNIVSGLKATNRLIRWKKNERKSYQNRRSKNESNGFTSLRDKLERRN